MKLSLRNFTFLLICIINFSCSTNKTEQEKPIIIDTLPPAENSPYPANDQSPMDMSYFPSSYPLQKMAGKDSTGGPLVRVIYSRPHKKGRQIFGDTDKSLCRYGREWRLGANEATEIEFFRDAVIAGKRIEKGRYVLYCIPYADRWTIVLNTNLYAWGLHMDTSKDIFKTDIPVLSLSPALEDFTMVFVPAENGAELLMAWDNVKALLPIRF